MSFKIDVLEVIEIAKQFLQIPSLIDNENLLLNYLNKEILKLKKYETILNKDCLIVKSNLKTKSNLVFSAHVDRHGFILNEDKQLEYLAFYLKRKLNLKFVKDELDENEKLLYFYLKEKLEDIDIKLTDENLIFSYEGKSFKYTRQGRKDFFEKIGLRYARDEIFSYDFINGNILNKYIISDFICDIKDNKVIYNTIPKIFQIDSNNLFLLNPQIIVDKKYFSGQIDNVISVAVLFYLLKNINFNHEIIFSTNEEIGLSYLGIEDYFNQKENLDKSLIVLDVSPYLNFNDKNEGFLTLRKGDEYSNFNLDLTDKIKNLLIKNNIDFDFKESLVGKTELGKLISISNKNICGSTLQLPSLNPHTSYEKSYIKSLENYITIITKL